MLFTVTSDIHSHYRNIVLYDPYYLLGESGKIRNTLQFTCQYLPQALALRCYWELHHDKQWKLATLVMSRLVPGMIL